MRENDYSLLPYEPCPVHPENKFKFCCYKLAKSNPLKSTIGPNFSDSRIDYLIKTMWGESDFHECLGFNTEQCSGVIKGAHTIQNNRILDKISDDGHVYHFKNTSSRSGVVASLDKISRNKASTFFGFCDYHDSALFKEIELFDYQEMSFKTICFHLEH